MEIVSSHIKVDSGDGSKFYCGTGLIRETSSPSNMFCDECPFCGSQFSTHGTALNGLNVVIEEGEYTRF